MVLKKTKFYYIFDSLIFIFILYWSLFPSRFTPKLILNELIMSFSDLSIIILVFLFCPFLFLNLKYFSLKEVILLCFSFIVFWAALSLLRIYDKHYIPIAIYTLLMSWLSMFVGYLISKSQILYRKFERNFLTKLSLVLCMIFVIYAFQSIFHAGFRSQAIITESLGIERLKGPLGGAAVIQFIMIIVFAVLFGNLQNNRKPKTLYIITTIITGINIFLTGSRSGLIGIVFFFLLLILSRRSIRLYIKLIIIIIAVLIILTPIIKFDRFRNFEDQTRFETYQKGLYIVLSSLDIFIFGKGYGNVWPWYKREMEFMQGLNISNIYYNPFVGKLLYHPHSVFLELFVELGLISVIPFIIILISIVKKLIILLRIKKYDINFYIVIGLLSTFPMMFLDLYFFKNWKISTIWWIYLFSSI
ncbi:MAG: hypothetical protein PWQ60_615 [Thermoanaerobacteraceae bacterium]|nr:hypothetical protein [Thermoanaerobacteraceae bacterium]